MCCLGFYLQACGVRNGDLVGIPKPSMRSWWPGQSELSELGWLFSKHHYAENALVLLNDTRAYSPEEREGGIRNLFGENGITVHFVD